MFKPLWIHPFLHSSSEKSNLKIITKIHQNLATQISRYLRPCLPFRALLFGCFQAVHAPRRLHGETQRQLPPRRVLHRRGISKLGVDHVCADAAATELEAALGVEEMGKNGLISTDVMMVLRTCDMVMYPISCPFGKKRGAGLVYHLSSCTCCFEWVVSSPSIHQSTNGKRTSMAD